MENTFKSSVFGGFNRDDVIRYIEKTALESKQRIEQLEQESDALCRENASLRDELSDAKGAHDKLAGSYSAALELQVTLKKQLGEAQEALAALKAQYETDAQALEALRAQSAQEQDALRQDYERRLREQKGAQEQALAEARESSGARLSALESERAQLAGELETLRPQLDEYARVKAHIAEIELSARERADALDTATRVRAQELIDACTKQCELVIATLGTTCANVSSELRRTDAMISQLPAAFNTLRTDLKELQKLEKEQ